MSTIDKQHIAAVRKLEQPGYTFAGADWMHPADGASPTPAIMTNEGISPLRRRMIEDMTVRNHRCAARAAGEARR
jgi:hypothetical protein